MKTFLRVVKDQSDVRDVRFVEHNDENEGRAYAYEVGQARSTEEVHLYPFPTTTRRVKKDDEQSRD